MLYNITINQKAIIDNRLNITANHVAIMEVVAYFILSTKAQSLNDELGQWYWVSYELIIDQIPMFDIKKDRCRQLVKELCNEGLLEANPNNQSLGRVYLRVGNKYSTYKNFEKPLVKNSQPPLEEFSNPLANNLATPLVEISDDNSINNNSTKENFTKENNSFGYTMEGVVSNEFINDLNKEKEKNVAPKKEKELKAIEVLDHLNTLAGKRYTPTKTNLNFITARLGEGNTVEDLKCVIELKVHEWINDPKMNTYLRPETLFNATKFQTYIQKVESIKKNPEQFKNEQRINSNGTNRNRPDSAENIASMFSSIDSAFGGRQGN